MNEIVKFEDERGQAVQVTAQDVRNVICPGATDKEIGMFLELCRLQHLNPWTKEVYLVKYGSAPASMITGKEVFTKRANRNPNFEGMEHGVVVAHKGPSGVKLERREGAAVYPEFGEVLAGGWARVYVKGKRPVYAELALAEYSTGKSNWAKMPAVMINKCAQVAALRLAFPEEYQGMYTPEEMSTAGEMVEDAKPAPRPVQQVQAVEVEPMEEEAPQVEATQEMTEQQGNEIARLCEEFAAFRGKSQREVYAALLGTRTMRQMGADASHVLTVAQADAACKVLAGWVKKAEDDMQAHAPATVQYAEVYVDGNDEGDYADEPIEF